MEVPPWVVVMCNTLFFGICSSHANIVVNAKRNNNIVDHFCIDCVKPLCSNCLHDQHQNHNHVKIRRYIYNDVIKKKDLSNIFDCCGIQTYHTNKEKVIFLKQRRSEQQVQEKEKEKEKEKEQASCNKKEGLCFICAKSLQDSSLYCSIACKVTHIANDEDKGDGFGGVQDSKVEDGKRTKKSLMCKKRRRKRRRKGFPFRAPMF